MQSEKNIAHSLATLPEQPSSTVPRNFHSQICNTPVSLSFNLKKPDLAVKSTSNKTIILTEELKTSNLDGIRK